MGKDIKTVFIINKTAEVQRTSVMGVKTNIKPGEIVEISEKEWEYLGRAYKYLFDEVPMDDKRVAKNKNATKENIKNSKNKVAEPETLSDNGVSENLSNDETKVGDNLNKVDFDENKLKEIEQYISSGLEISIKELEKDYVIFDVMKAKIEALINK